MQCFELVGVVPRVSHCKFNNNNNNFDFFVEQISGESIHLKPLASRLALTVFRSIYILTSYNVSIKRKKKQHTQTSRE